MFTNRSVDLIIFHKSKCNFHTPEACELNQTRVFRHFSIKGNTTFVVTLQSQNFLAENIFKKKFKNLVGKYFCVQQNIS